MVTKRTFPRGYTPADISGALVCLGIKVSGYKIRSYANKNNIASRTSNQIQVIPEHRLEELIEGMEIPVRVLDLYNALHRE